MVWCGPPPSWAVVVPGATDDDLEWLRRMSEAAGPYADVFVAAPIDPPARRDTDGALRWGTREAFAAAVAGWYGGTIENPAAPTDAELAAGCAIDLTCYLTGDGLTPPDETEPPSPWTSIIYVSGPVPPADDRPDVAVAIQA